MKKEKIIIIVLIIIIVGLGGYIGYDKFLSKNNEVTEKNNKVEEKEVEKDKTNQANIESNDSTAKVINFDRKKCLDKDSPILDEKNYSLLRDGHGEFVSDITMSIGENEKTVNVYLTSDSLIGKKLNIKEDEKHELVFDKKVEYIFGGIFSAEYYGGTSYIFLLEDGTIEHMDLYKIYENNIYEHKLVEGVSDIVRFDNISTNPNEGMGANFTAIAYKADGSFYDLSKNEAFKNVLNNQW